MGWGVPIGGQWHGGESMGGWPAPLIRVGSQPGVVPSRGKGCRRLASQPHPLLRWGSDQGQGWPRVGASYRSEWWGLMEAVASQGEGLQEVGHPALPPIGIGRVQSGGWAGQEEGREHLTRPPRT